jgi:predicted DNA-binding transcriptional regulator YafY
MDKRDKLYQLHRIFSQAHGKRISKAELLERLEYSDSTLKRQINTLRDEYGAPLEYDAEKHGWYYQKGIRFELPGLWFNEQELYSLLVLEQLLEKIDAGLVSEQLSIAKDRIKLLLSTKIDLDKNIDDKLRLVTVFQRDFNKTNFKEIAKATFEQRQLEIESINRQTQQHTVRIISPQRLVHYKDVWYLDCYCHLRESLRTLAIDAISRVKQCHKAAKIIDPTIIDEQVQHSYGIFSGQANKTAILHFQPPASFWIAKETWHPEQKRRWLDNDILELTIPFQKQEELLADILRYSDKVTVKSPESLRQSIRKHAEILLQNHK